VITLAHNLTVLRIPYSDRLFAEPAGDYHVALGLVVDRVSETNRRERERAERQS